MTSLRPCNNTNLIDTLVKDPIFKIKMNNNLDKIFKLNQNIPIKCKKKNILIDKKFKKDYINYFVNRYYHIKLFTDNIQDITTDEESSDEDIETYYSD
jgi:hypothetical protein